MASFNKMSVWPIGYFRAYSSWLLRDRREIGLRIATINAEIARIGLIQVTYRTVTSGENTTVTEERMGFSVTPEGSSLSKLVMAYIANGGNPFDISPFWYPDSTEVVSTDADGNQQTIQKSPYGGVLAPMSALANDPLPGTDSTGFGGHRGGWVRADHYYPARQGGRISQGSFDSDMIVKTMHQIRSWDNQAIKERLLEIEARILKLCDLREQLTHERDEVLVQAFGGVLDGVGDFDEDRFANDLRVQNLVQDMYEMLFETEEDGTVRAFKGNSKSDYYQFTFDDLPSEYPDAK